ncbi:hypothetical protein AB3S75_027372 [Citrus x aurantiifolia]
MCVCTHHARIKEKSPCVGITFVRTESRSFRATTQGIHMDFCTLLFGYIAIHTLSTLDGDKPWDDWWSPALLSSMSAGLPRIILSASFLHWQNTAAFDGILFASLAEPWWMEGG